MKKTAKILSGVAGGLVAALVAGYIGMSSTYSSKFLPNTYLNQMNVGGKTVEEAKEALQDSTSDHLISLIKSDGSKEDIYLSEIGFTTEYADDIHAIQEGQNRLMWLMTALGEDEYTVELKTSYDTRKLEELIKKLKCVSGEAVQAPVDAHIEKTSTGYEIVDAIDGNKLDEKKLQELLIDALENGKTEIDLAAEDCYLKAKVKADDPKLIASLANVTRFADMVITVDLVGAQEKLDYELLNAWIETDGDKVKVDKEQVENYVIGLSVQYNTYKTERQFTTTNAGVITVGGSHSDVDDTYGFQMDIDATTEALVSAIEKGKSSTVEAEWNIPALTRDAENGDIGSTYIEIDLTSQHLWYYQDGVLALDYDIVSGKPNDAQRTPTGVFRIWSKERDTALSGENAYGATWSNVPVEYWMPITWTGVGIHDADWQQEFGGNVYETLGSQGCLNSPPKMVAKLYDMVGWDTPVIIYKS